MEFTKMDAPFFHFNGAVNADSTSPTLPVHLLLWLVRSA